jgi:hypothetical protein
VKFNMEHKSEPLLPWRLFVRRLYVSFGLGAALILASLSVGMAGYHYFEGLGWIDAYLNATMILSGMGPLDPPRSFGGKLFAGLYALYSGFAVLVIAGIAFGPFVHRVLHKFHADEEDMKNHASKARISPRPVHRPGQRVRQNNG